MMSHADFVQLHPEVDVTSLLSAPPEADIGSLIDLTMQSQNDALAVVEDGQVVGIVTTRSLLRGVAGTPDTTSCAA
jgi:glycine betaine/proline transport system ATP-binding protein